MPIETNGSFRVESAFAPAGDQPDAIANIANGIDRGNPHQTILGVTGSGKTFVMAKVIEAITRPALVISHNKTLTAQLFHEFRQFFPSNAVEYFVSYYDYYQPEAYIASSGTYIEKDSSINDEIERLRHRATAAMFTRRDYMVVASISCIYGLGSPEAYEEMSVHLDKTQLIPRDEIISKLVEIQYQRNDVALSRGKFRARGDTLEIFPISADTALRVELFGDEIEAIVEFDPLTNQVLRELDMVTIFPAQHYVTLPERRQAALTNIEAELEERVAHFKGLSKAIEAQRIYERTMYDLELMREIGFCKGIENYSRHLAGRPAGSPPETLCHYLPKDAIIFIDESHVTLPQVQGMYRGDQARKTSLVDYGFRLPSAFDNRPLTFEEFDKLPQQKVYISATPSGLERARSGDHVAELIVRPTGLVDPEIIIRPLGNQVDDVIQEITKRAEQNERVLVTTLTKVMAEELTAYLADAGIRVRYLHSEITTFERMDIIRDLRLGKFDALVGINLLREGLDIPECSLVAVLDADKEGFLRSTTSLIQTCGRAARNANGQVILYADQHTDSIKEAVAECDRRRVIQQEYNVTHNIQPVTIVKAVPERLHDLAGPAPGEEPEGVPDELTYSGTLVELPFFIAQLREKISTAIAEERYEDAIPLRDKVYELEKQLADGELRAPTAKEVAATRAGSAGTSAGKATRRGSYGSERRQGESPRGPRSPSPKAGGRRMRGR
jgi:excinuclease ABC subunit B